MNRTEPTPIQDTPFTPLIAEIKRTFAEEIGPFQIQQIIYLISKFENVYRNKYLQKKKDLSIKNVIERTLSAATCSSVDKYSVILLNQFSYEKLIKEINNDLIGCIYGAMERPIVSLSEYQGYVIRVCNSIEDYMIEIW